MGLCTQLFDGTMSTDIKSLRPSSTERYIQVFEFQVVDEEEI